MKVPGILSHVLVVAGVLLMGYALVGRFTCDRSVLGFLIEGGMSASAVMLGANACLLLAILAHLNRKS